MCLNIKGTDTFESFQTKQKYKINHHLNCNRKSLVYLLSCKVCGLQYVGSTTDKFRFRWNNYKENDSKTLRREEYMQQELFEHFIADNQVSWMTVVLHWLIKQMVQIPREENWRKFLKTVASYELNTLSWWLLLRTFIFPRQEFSLRKMYTLKSYLCVL